MNTAHELDAWERAYRDFETPAGEMRKFGRRLHALGADRLDLSSRILEICCGRGNALIAWQRLGFRRAVGLDLSYALLRLSNAGAPRIVGDVRAMPVADASQDIVAVHGGLHHLRSLEDLEATLGEMRRVIRPGGHIVIVEPWSTPFLTAVHALSRQPLIRRLWQKMDAFERMYEHEQKTYDAWLGQPDAILALVHRYLTPLVLHRRWGKLMVLARRAPERTGARRVR
ncbi:MAG: class I SAM-dependent methyltransferase [Acidobacteria bacterium]|nr:class I SAM-dependent methyltransferase [Acidobacteriota bacterium]